MRVSNKQMVLALLAGLALSLLASSDAIAQRGRGGGGGGGGGRVGGGGGGGGARPSIGNVGGGGARPSMPMSRPSTPSMNMSRPNGSGPTFGNASARPANTRPSMPNMGTGSLGANRPSLGGAGNLTGATRPNISRPTTLPSNPSLGNRPNIGTGGGLTGPGGSDRPTLGNTNRPSTLPGTINKPGDLTKPAPGANRPNIGTDRPSTLPGNINRPSTLPGNVNRPNLGTDRPSTLPGTINRPNIGTNRPSTLPGNINRPNIGTDRPSTLPGTINRPNLGGERPSTLPGVVQRPGSGTNRPGIGGDRPIINGNRPNNNLANINRPSVGNNINNGNININRPSIGVGNRPGAGNINVGNNINIGNSVNIGNRPVNRPNWDLDPGYSRPGWGINSNDWHNNWHNNCINNRYNWYNGCWHGYWGSSWYAPVAWGAVGWGLNSWTSGWGNNVAYYNPYYAVPVVSQEMPYDYSQPVVINNYVSSDSASNGGDTQVTQQNSQERAALAAFDNGLDKFKSADYRGALSDFDKALKMLPGDAVVHETRCLALFAVADYSKAAAGLNSYLAVAPGMDWTTMSGLYGNIEDYTTQLRSLERYTVANPSDASSHFVLAYHYLVTGSKEAATEALGVVVSNQPKDVTAKRMFDALSPAKTAPAVSPPAATAAPAPAAPAANADADALETDLVGTWVAQTGNSKIELGIAEDSAFTWKASGKDQPPVELKGSLNSLSDGIELVTAEQGTVAGAVKSKGADGWNFKIAGAPTTDPGLDFKRLK